MKNWSIAPVLAILFFLFVPVSDAAVIADYVCLSQCGSENIGNMPTRNRVDQTFRTLSGHTSLDFSLELFKTGNPSDLIITLYENDNGIFVWPTVPVSGWSTASISEGLVGTNTFNTFNFNVTGPALTPNVLYSLVIETAVWDDVNNFYSIKKNNPSIDGDGWTHRYDLASDSWSAPFSPEYSTLIQDGAPPATPNEIIVPQDLDVLTETTFVVSGTCDASEYISVDVRLMHKESSQFIQSESAFCIFNTWEVYGIGSTAWNDEYDLSLWGGIPFDPNDIPFLPVLDHIEITINVIDNPVPPPPGITTDLGCDTGETIADALCTVFSWLFIPTNQSMAQFGDLWDKVKNKPPIGYITAGLTTWNTLAHGTSSESLDGTNDLSNYFGPVKATVATLLWMLFLVWIIKRIGSMAI